MAHTPIKLFCSDLNWIIEAPGFKQPSAPHDWAFLDPEEYFKWHLDFGNNAFFCQAYTHGGYAFYPTKLGPVAPGPGKDLLPTLYELTREARMPFWSYFCVGTDLILNALRWSWRVPETTFLAPESPWTDLLCERIREFLGLYPVDWILFDWFVYGDTDTNGAPVKPARFVEKPFREIIGRPMPASAEEITPEENIAYKREVLTRQFLRIRKAVKETSPQTRMIFNVPYQEANEALWVDHPMLRESEGLFSECTNTAVMEWLLSIRRPEQHVMTTVCGSAGPGKDADPHSWRQWYERGCDFFAYASGPAPDFRPCPYAQMPDIEEQLAMVRQAFQEMP